MNRTDRLYAITEALRGAGPRGLTSAALAERFEVAARTVKRDVTALQEAGLPIAATGGPGGGYVLDGSATLPPITFTVGEAMAVAVAVATQRPPLFAADGRRALTKVLGAVPPATRLQAETLAGRVWVRGVQGAHPGESTGDEVGGGRSPGTPPPGPVPAAQRVVEEAVRTGTVVLIDYVDAAGRTSVRRPVDALGLVDPGSGWHLLAWCRRKDAGRWFRLDRITAAHATTQAVVTRDVATAFGVPPADAGPITMS